MQRLSISVELSREVQIEMVSDRLLVLTPVALDRDRDPFS